jgi:hypothetical protein
MSETGGEVIPDQNLMIETKDPAAIIAWVEIFFGIDKAPIGTPGLEPMCPVGGDL